MSLKSLRQKSLLIGMGILFVIGIIVAAEISFRLVYKNYENKEAEKSVWPKFIKESFDEFIKREYIGIYDKCFKKVKKERREIYATHQEKLMSLLYQEFSVNKGEYVVRIFITGGSVAQIYSHKIDSLYEEFQKHFPGVHFEIINCAGAGFDSYRVSLIVKEVLNYDPDLLILISGNNEEHYDPVRLNVNNANMHLYKLSQSLSKKMMLFCYLKDRYSTWMREKIVSSEAIDEEDRLKEYKRNITQIIEWTKKRNIPLVICTLPANFRDWSPEGGSSWGKEHFLKSWGLYLNGSYYKAINGFERLLMENPEDAFGHFSLARCYEKINDFAQAKFHYLKALEFRVGDRCPPSRNSLLRMLCKQHGAILVDLAKTFEDLAPHNLVGVEFFQDNCHFWWYYYDLVSREIVKSAVVYNKLHPDFMKDFSANKSSYNINLEKEFFPLKDLGEEEAFRLFTSVTFFFYEGVFLPRDNIRYFSEFTLSFFEQAYHIDPSIFTDINKLKEPIEMFFNDVPLPYASLTELSQARQEKFWSIFFLHVAEILRRNHQFHLALEYANEALKDKSSWNLAYLCRGLIYASLEDEQAALDFKKAEELLPENPWVKWRDDLVITSLQGKE